MEIFGGMAVMAGIMGFFLTVVWLVMPFVVFAVKGKLDRAVYLLEELDKKIQALDERLVAMEKRGQPPAQPLSATTASSENPD